ncbi:MAG: hypothetical protein AVDCRST_MAG03-974, partial [uncultured Rubrobacteraceae bacterium]
AERAVAQPVDHRVRRRRGQTPERLRRQGLPVLDSGEHRAQRGPDRAGQPRPAAVLRRRGRGQQRL